MSQQGVIHRSTLVVQIATKGTPETIVQQPVCGASFPFELLQRPRAYDW